ncbi:MAG: ATP-binding protein [Firmicutes bacterium]|nr:ATP-binding protein [Bacillota bacterium]
MTKKILTGVIGVSLVIMLVCVGLVMGIMYDYMGQKIDEQMADEAILAEEAWLAGGQDFLDSMEQRPDIKSRITVISSDGKVLYDSMADSTKMENHLEREEVKEALTDGIGKASRTSYTLEEDTRYYAKKTADGNVIRISTSHYSQLGLLLDTFGMIIITVSVLIVLSVFISYRVARAIVKPINDIDLDNPDISENYEELGPLLHRIHQQNIKIKGQMENLRRSREEFSIITENMSEGLIIIDKDAEILTYNRSAAHMLRSSGGRTEGSVLKLNRSEPFRKAVNEALSGKNATTYLDEGNSVYEIIANPASDKDEVTGAIIIIMDVTEKERGETLRREFTSNVSHELKTPLTSIYGVSDMLASGLVKPEDVAGFAGTIKEEASRLISLIDDIIKLSRLDESTGPQQMETIDVFETARDAVNRLSVKAQSANVELSLSGEPSEIVGVQHILDEIIYNVCENAIKYNRPGGFVRISVRNDDDESLITVSDSGIGIPKADRERVFERFYRVDKSHSKEIGGTGLGLSIVKHGVMYLGGRVELESEEGKGTVVTVRLPQA